MPPDTPALPLNPLRSALEQGETVFGLGVRLARTPELVALAGAAGYRWLFVDIEHSPMSIETAAGLSVTALAGGVTPLARLSAGDYSLAARLLDSGAWGVLVSHVETAEDEATYPLRASYLITDQPQAVIGFLFPSLRRFGGHAQRGESAQLGESDQSGSI